MKKPCRVFYLLKSNFYFLLDDSFQEKNTAVDNLRGSVKCSLADFVDINTIGNIQYN